MGVVVDRVFLDANVLFSAAYGSPGPTRLWTLATEGQLELLTSGYATEEARRNLDRKEQKGRLADLLSAVKTVSEPDPGLSCPDTLPSKVRPLLLAAIQAGATHFVTGDLKQFGTYRGRRPGC
ncbi:MAG: PIN domain-containing protein [Moorellales bacterium]